jgi:iron-sulfur cluster repair protein YtfE (RIC family)
MTETSQSITDSLRSDHDAITRLVDDATTPAGTAAVREQLVMELVRHFVAEEQYLYPEVRQVLPDGDAIADAAFGEHRECEKTLRALEGDDLTAEHVASTLGAVRATFARHVQGQHATLFPALERGCPPIRLAELGADVRGAEQLAPTRPRAVASAAPALNKIESLVEGFIDHVRDAHSRRGVVEDR